MRSTPQDTAQQTCKTTPTRAMAGAAVVAARRAPMVVLLATPKEGAGELADEIARATAAAAMRLLAASEEGTGELAN